MFRKFQFIKKLSSFKAQPSLPNKAGFKLSLCQSCIIPSFFQRNTKPFQALNSTNILNPSAAFSSSQNQHGNLSEEEIVRLIQRGRAHCEKSEGKEALEIFDQVFEHDEKAPETSLGESSLDIYQRVEKLELFGDDAWKSVMKRAQKSMKKALDFVKKDYGEHSEQAFYLTYQLAKIFAQKEKDSIFLKGRITEALPFAEKSLEIALNVFPKESLEVGKCYKLLGEVHLTLRDFTKSLEFCQKAFEAFGNQDTVEAFDEIEDVYFLMAVNYFNKGESEEADDFFSKILQVRFECQKGQDTRLAQKYFEWAKLIQGDENRTGESKEYLERCLEIHNGQVPVNKAQSAEIKLYLGKIAQHEGDSDKASELWKESKAELAMVNPLERFQDARSDLLSNIVFGTTALNEGSFDESVRYLRDATVTIESYQLYRDPRIQKVYFDLGRAYEGQGSLPAAWNSYSDAYTLNKKHLGKEHAETQTVLEKLDEIKKKLKAAGQEDATKIISEGQLTPDRFVF